MADFPPDEIAAVIDDNGRIQAQFSGFGAASDARSFLNRCQGAGKLGDKKGPVPYHLTKATVITGPKAQKAIEEGRL